MTQPPTNQASSRMAQRLGFTIDCHQITVIPS